MDVSKNLITNDTTREQHIMSNEVMHPKNYIKCNSNSRSQINVNLASVENEKQLENYLCLSKNANCNINITTVMKVNDIKRKGSSKIVSYHNTDSDSTVLLSDDDSLKSSLRENEENFSPSFESDKNEKYNTDVHFSQRFSDSDVDYRPTEAETDGDNIEDDNRNISNVSTVDCNSQENYKKNASVTSGKKSVVHKHLYSESSHDSILISPTKKVKSLAEEFMISLIFAIFAKNTLIYVIQIS